MDRWTAFPDGIEAIPPGPELGALLAVWLPRQRTLPLRTGQAPRHAPRPTRSGIAEIAQLHDWPEGAAAYKLTKIHDALVRLLMLHEAMVAGNMDAELADAYSTATHDLPDPFDRHPADLGRWATIHADLARTLTHRHATGQWASSVFRSSSTTPATSSPPTSSAPDPHGWPTRQARDTSHIDLLVPVSVLKDLTAGPLDPTWTAVIAEIAARAETARTRRLPTIPLRRLVLARTPTCAWRLCRRPSRPSEIDHGEEHCLGGPTTEENLRPYCPPHHALKSRYGWHTGPTTYDLISHLDTVHHVALPPTLRPPGRPCPHWRHVLRHLLHPG